MLVVQKITKIIITLFIINIQTCSLTLHGTHATEYQSMRSKWFKRKTKGLLGYYIVSIKHAIFKRQSNSCETKIYNSDSYLHPLFGH